MSRLAAGGRRSGQGSSTFYLNSAKQPQRQPFHTSDSGNQELNRLCRHLCCSANEIVLHVLISYLPSRAQRTPPSSAVPISAATHRI